MSPLIAASLVVFLEGLGFGLGLPVLTAYTRELGGDVAMGGWMFALATLPRIVMGPIFGRMSDRMGRRWTLAVVTVGTTGASVMWGLCPSLGGTGLSAVAWLLASRAVYGVFASQSVLALAVASDVSTPQKRATAMGIVGAAFGVAFTIGPALGGAAAEAYGSAMVGHLAAISQMMSLGVILLLLRETHPHHQPGADGGTIFAPASSVLALALAPRNAALMLVTFLGTVAYSVMLPTYEPIARMLMDWDKRQVGYAWAAFGLIGAVVQGGLFRRMAHKLGERSASIVGLLTLGAGLAWIALHPGPGGFWTATALMAIGTGLSTPGLTTLMSKTVGESDQGAIHGLNYSATSLGRGMGYLLGAQIYARVSPGATYLVGAAAALGAMFLLFRPSKPR
jgi:DHA1 family tetracycline resistance protein-like MFS transporter